MTVAFETGYTLPSGDLPLNHARVLHDGNRFKVKTVTASDELALYPGSAANSGDTVDRWRPFANEVLDPTDFSTANWTAANLTVGSDGQTLTETTATANHQIGQANLTFTAVENVVAFRVERQTVPEIRIVVTDGGVNTFGCYFDLRDGTVGNASGGAIGKIVVLDGGVFLCLMRFTPAATSSGIVRLRLANGSGTDNYTGSTSNTVKVTQAIVHLSDATLSYDLFTAQEGDTFAIAAHNLWSSGAALSVQYESPERITNGDFSGGGVGWTGYAGVTFSGGELVAISAAQIVRQESVFEVGKTYIVTFDYTETTSVRLRIENSLVGGADVLATSGTISGTGSGTLSFTVSPTSSGLFVIAASGSVFTGTIDNVSVKEVQSDGAEFAEIGSVTPTDNSPVMFIYEPITSAKSRIQVSGGALPEIGVFRVGKSLQMERPFYGGFTIPRMARNAVVRGNISGSGELLGRSLERTTLNTQYQWQHLSYAWVRANLDGPNGLVQAAETEPLFLAWRPSETQDVDYVMRASTQAPNAMGLRDLWTFGMSGEAYSYE